MFVLLLILLVVLFGLGFLNPLWWVFGAVLLFVGTRYGRSGRRGFGRRDADIGEYGEYLDRREREDLWDRRSGRPRRGRWIRQDRRDREYRD
ncbi:hypothetical protein G3I40_28470 [Streptomyces sp. SID14478]|uniref:hypothetical protein n=1 Tax=Streptomyces sp. SID14478 TaxID=2706073 RepID=UPI0013DA89F9|nr:hypothetical protein [Streptomyces sp. SID14478]